jgi:hypothetical protein
MARFYSNENMPLPVVEELRRLGHDVLTSFEAGNANRSIADDEVLKFASSQSRIVLTLTRKHFIRLHQSSSRHAGIVVCSFDPDSMLRPGALIRSSVKRHIHQVY